MKIKSNKPSNPKIGQIIYEKRFALIPKKIFEPTGDIYIIWMEHYYKVYRWDEALTDVGYGMLALKDWQYQGSCTKEGLSDTIMEIMKRPLYGEKPKNLKREV